MPDDTQQPTADVLLSDPDKLTEWVGERRKLANEATDGPLTTGVWGDGLYDPHGLALIGECHLEAPQDARFFADARTSLPLALDLIEKLAAGDREARAYIRNLQAELAQTREGLEAENEKLAAERDSYKRILKEQEELSGRLDMAIGDAITAAGKGVYDRMTNDMERTADAPQVIRELAAERKPRRFGDERPKDGQDVLLFRPAILDRWQEITWNMEGYPGQWHNWNWHGPVDPEDDDLWLPMPPAPALPAVPGEGEKP